MLTCLHIIVLLYLGKKHKLKMFPVQIQWEFASAVPFSNGAAGWGKRSDGIAPDRENTMLQLKSGGRWPFNDL